MSAWDTATFTNDDAAEWAGELDEAEDPLGHVDETFAEVEDVGDDYLEVNRANRAIAASAWLASALPGGPVYGNDIPAPPPWVAADLADRAVVALERVLASESEWRELWDESDNPTHAVAAVDAIANLLRQHAA